MPSGNTACPSVTTTCQPPTSKVSEPSTAQRLMARTAAFASSLRGQPEKAQSPIERPSGSGSVIEERAEQPQKAPSPMEVRPAGKVTEVRAEQLWKAQSPMEARVAGT